MGRGEEEEEEEEEEIWGNGKEVRGEEEGYDIQDLSFL